MDFSHRNVTYNMKQLMEVLHCDLQVTIHEGLMETQTELLETVSSFVDHFQSEWPPCHLHRCMPFLTTSILDGGVVRPCLMSFKEEKHE